MPGAIIVVFVDCLKELLATLLIVAASIGPGGLALTEDGPGSVMTATTVSPLTTSSRPSISTNRCPAVSPSRITSAPSDTLSGVCPDAISQNRAHGWQNADRNKIRRAW